MINLKVLKINLKKVYRLNIGTTDDRVLSLTIYEKTVRVLYFMYPANTCILMWPSCPTGCWPLISDNSPCLPSVSTISGEYGSKVCRKVPSFLYLHHCTGQIYLGILKSHFLRKVKSVPTVISETFFTSHVMCQGLHYKRQLQGTKSPQEPCIQFSVCNVIFLPQNKCLYKIPPYSIFSQPISPRSPRLTLSFYLHLHSQIASFLSKFLTNISYKTRHDLLRQ